MTCDQVQAELSRAIDEGREGSAVGGHLSLCPACGEFLALSERLADRYRRQVRRGIDRLGRSMPVRRPRPSPARLLLPLAAAVLILLSVPVHAPPRISAPPARAAGSRVPLFDVVAPDPVDLQILAWSGDLPLPRRLDQDLPGPGALEPDPGLSLPAGLRF